MRPKDNIPPAPKGWTEEEWRRTLLGAPQPKRGLLGSGRSWLLPAILGLVFIVVIVMVLVSSY